VEKYRYSSCVTTLLFAQFQLKNLSRLIPALTLLSLLFRMIVTFWVDH